MKPEFLYANGLKYKVTAETEISYVGRPMHYDGELFYYEMTIHKNTIGKAFFLTETESKNYHDKKAKYESELKQLQEKYGI